RYLFPLYAPLAIVAAGCLAAMAATPDHAQAVPRMGQRVAWLGLCLQFAGYNLGTFLEIRASSLEMYQDHLKSGALGTTLAGFPGVSVAVSEVGQLPYYSGCRVLDLCGLNDPFIARNRYKDPHFTQRFGEYLQREFGLPDVYVEPPEEYAYSSM